MVAHQHQINVLFHERKCNMKENMGWNLVEPLVNGGSDSAYRVRTDIYDPTKVAVTLSRGTHMMQIELGVHQAMRMSDLLKTAAESIRVQSVPSKEKWIGVDLDGTLAYYIYGDIHFHGQDYIGSPIELMVRRVKRWLEDGENVKIFTARIATDNLEEKARTIANIEKWCLEHIGQVLPITNVKDRDMKELWDDRARQVHLNMGVQNERE